MRATRSGHVIGKALTELSQGDGLVLVFIEPGFRGMGDGTTSGLLAGRVTTDAAGVAQVRFAQPFGPDLPVAQLTVEGERLAFAQITRFVQDEAGLYTGLVIKTFAPTSAAAPAVPVHYIVHRVAEELR
ncbi:MAG: hypothetical protein HYV03_05425 [Deltaproteobacteria bacterium]|nr:hypothetical protein [Deltaproteobacteria bacterium]